jgi:hypothetical protein
MSSRPPPHRWPSRQTTSSSSPCAQRAWFSLRRA